MKKNDIAVFAVIVLLIAWWVIYSRYSMKSEAADSIKIQNNQSTDTGETVNKEDNTIMLTYQWEWIKNVSNTFFDDMTKWENVVTWISVPWEIAFRKDGKMYITERAGNILLYDSVTKQQTIWTHIDVAEGQWYEKWLLWLAIDPYNDEIV